MRSSLVTQRLRYVWRSRVGCVQHRIGGSADMHDRGLRGQRNICVRRYLGKCTCECIGVHERSVWVSVGHVEIDGREGVS